MEAAARLVVSTDDTIEEVKGLLQEFPRHLGTIQTFEEFCQFAVDGESVSKCILAERLYARFQEQPNAVCHTDKVVIDLNERVGATRKLIEEYQRQVFEAVEKVCRSGKPSTVTKFTDVNWFKNFLKLLASFQAWFVILKFKPSFFLYMLCRCT